MTATDSPSTETHPTERANAVAAVQALTRASRVLERASSELSLADFRVLSAVAGGEARASRIAHRLAIGRPTISAAVDSLCKRGLLNRSDVEGDQRASALSLTEKGTTVREHAESDMVRRIELLCARTPDAARALEVLAWLGSAIEEAITERTEERHRTA